MGRVDWDHADPRLTHREQSLDITSAIHRVLHEVSTALLSRVNITLPQSSPYVVYCGQLIIGSPVRRFYDCFGLSVTRFWLKDTQILVVFLSAVIRFLHFTYLRCFFFLFSVQADLLVVSLFSTQENGVLLQDHFPIDSRYYSE